MSVLEEGEVLVLGASGQLGAEILRALAARGIPARGAARTPRSGWLELDLAAAEGAAARVRALRPAVVFNAAAYTAVDAAEDDAATAFAVNAEGPGALARVCRELDALLVHFSTDYVFDGATAGAYREGDAPAPLGRYGASKLAGEEAVAASGARHLIFRTSWLYTPGGRNFVTTMLRLFRERETVQVVADQHGCPTWARSLASALVERLARVSRDWLAGRLGLYHLASTGETTWYDFARAIHARAEPPPRATLEAIDSAAWKAAARRPARAVLDSTRARERLGIALPPWEQQLAAAMPEFNTLARTGGDR